MFSLDAQLCNDSEESHSHYYSNFSSHNFNFLFFHKLLFGELKLNSTASARSALPAMEMLTFSAAENKQ
jgi:hypothetical protein